MAHSLEQVRRQVLRRVRYATNTLALRNHLVPPEGPFDSALTNGLLAIVSEHCPGQECRPDGKTKPARALLDILENETPSPLKSTDAARLRQGLDLTQPCRHGLADDEFASINETHIAALCQLDEHPALRFLSTAEGRSFDDCVWRAFLESAEQELPFAPKDRLDVPEPADCDECWRPTFLPSGWDMFGGTDSSGYCITCGYERSEEIASDRAIMEAVRRAVERDD